MLILCRVASQEFARARDHLTHFLTYADNNAVGYFAKQGFTKEITLEKDRVSQQQPRRPARDLLSHLYANHLSYRASVYPCIYGSNAPG